MNQDNKPRVFVITPFGEDFLALFEEFRHSFGDQFEFSNAGDMDNQQNILKDIVEGIALAEIIIADLTGLNANVYFQCTYLFLYFIIVSPHCILIHSHFSCNQTLICNLRVFSHIGGNQLFLLADAVWDGGQVTALLDGLNLRFHLFNQSRQESFTFLSRLGVHIPGVLLAVRPHGGIAAFPEVVADLADTAGTRFTYLADVRLEGGHCPLRLRLCR